MSARRYIQKELLGCSYKKYWLINKSIQLKDNGKASCQGEEQCENELQSMTPRSFSEGKLKDFGIKDKNDRFSLKDNSPLSRRL